MGDVETCHFIVDDPDGLVQGGKPSDVGMDWEPVRQRIVCQPFVSAVQCMVSAVHSAVNCPECRATAEWKKAAAVGVPELKIDAIPKRILDEIVKHPARVVEAASGD